MRRLPGPVMGTLRESRALAVVVLAVLGGCAGSSPRASSPPEPDGPEPLRVVDPVTGVPLFSIDDAWRRSRLRLQDAGELQVWGDGDEERCRLVIDGWGYEKLSIYFSASCVLEREQDHLCFDAEPLARTGGPDTSPASVVLDGCLVLRPTSAEIAQRRAEHMAFCRRMLRDEFCVEIPADATPCPIAKAGNVPPRLCIDTSSDPWSIVSFECSTIIFSHPTPEERPFEVRESPHGIQLCWPGMGYAPRVARVAVLDECGDDYVIEVPASHHYATGCSEDLIDEPKDGGT